MLLQTWLIVFASYIVILYITEAFCLYSILNIVRWNGNVGIDTLLSPDEMVSSTKGDFHLNNNNFYSFLWMCATMILTFFNSVLGLLTVKSFLKPMPTFRKFLWISVPISFVPLFPLHLLDQDLFEWVEVLVTVFVASSTILTLSLAVFVGLIEKEFHEKTNQKEWTLWNVFFET
ncbi:unnamed protein product [Bursaphelenchus okinawaensis]|uniref:Uncharacterized protein n=1 Tax=Bursaphelenchus okinawaensis TaxID=465554 RepID=A0A811LKX2_9BILA|nr:unnamed protein product [Bursaphelenchus okinawaensis]CAG9125228.1 unnamed protein product [Bursaphelenchus okinawaensis]